MSQIPIRDGLFCEVEDGPRLVGGRCGACGEAHFPRLDVCPWCGRDEVADMLLGPAGRLWGFTAVTTAPPGYRGEVPFGFGVVELTPGLRVVSRLTVADPSRLRDGQAMHLVLDVVHTDDDGVEVLTWAFAPDGEPTR